MWKLQKLWNYPEINIPWEVCIERINYRNLKIHSNLVYSVLIKMLWVMNLTIILSLWISYHSTKLSHNTVWIHRAQTRTLHRNLLEMNWGIGLFRMISRAIRGLLEELKGAREKSADLQPLVVKTKVKLNPNHRIPTTENPVFSLWWRFRSTTALSHRNSWKPTSPPTKAPNSTDTPWSPKTKRSVLATKTMKGN